MIKMLQRGAEEWKRCDVLRCLILLRLHWIFATMWLATYMRIVTFWFALRFSLFDISHCSISTETTSTWIPRIASFDYVLQRIQDSQILVTKGSIVELRTTDARALTIKLKLKNIAYSCGLSSHNRMTVIKKYIPDIFELSWWLMIIISQLVWSLDVALKHFFKY